MALVHQPAQVGDVAAAHGLNGPQRAIVLRDHVPRTAAVMGSSCPSLLRNGYGHVAQGADPEDAAAASHCERRSL